MLILIFFSLNTNFDTKDVEFTLKENGDVEWKFPEAQVDIGASKKMPKSKVVFFSRNVFHSLTATPLRFCGRGKASLLLFSSGERKS